MASTGNDEKGRQRADATQLGQADTPANDKPANNKAARLAAALRQNLQRRKAQARGRKAGSGDQASDTDETA